MKQKRVAIQVDTSSGAWMGGRKNEKSQNRPGWANEKNMEQKINTKYKIVETFVLGVPIVQLKKKVLFFWVDVSNTDTHDKIAAELQRRGVVDPVLMERKTMCL